MSKEKLGIEMNLKNAVKILNYNGPVFSNEPTNKRVKLNSPESIMNAMNLFGRNAI